MTVPDLQKCKRDGRKIAVVTAYDALRPYRRKQAGIDVILVGRFVGRGRARQGEYASVTMDEMLYHTKLVAGAVQRSLVIGDMPLPTRSTREAFAMPGDSSSRSPCGQTGRWCGGDDREGDGERRYPGDRPSRHDAQPVQQYGGYKVQERAKDRAQQLLRMRALEEAVLLPLSCDSSGIGKDSE